MALVKLLAMRAEGVGFDGCGARARGPRKGRCGGEVVGFLTVTRVAHPSIRVPRCEQHARPGSRGWSWVSWIDEETKRRIALRYVSPELTDISVAQWRRRFVARG